MASGHGSEAVEEAICALSKSSCLLQSRADCSTEPCAAQFTIIIFPFVALFLGTVATPVARFVKISYTLVLLMIGILIGILGCGIDLGLFSTSLRQWVHLNPPTIFFYVFLAPLIFEASFNTRWHVFKRLLIPILTAAFVIVILQVGLIAAFQKIVIRTSEWSWWAALMFGSMLSATDPISVTATLKSLGASELLNTLIEGESLVNDGSAFVLFEAFFENTVEEGSLTVGQIIASIFRLSIGGMAMGIAFGVAALIILGLVYDEFEVETSLTVIVAFLGFWTAQAPSKLSGVICNVASGLVISAFGRHLITPAVRGPLAEFWELLGWIANTIVFVHAGVLLSAFIWSCTGEPNEWYDYLYIIVYYIFLQVIRMGLIMLFSPIMRIRNQWFQWREAVVVGFSGLRGAVSLILALEVAGSAAIPDEVRSRVVLWTTGIVGLSLLVNGLLIQPLVHSLKLDKAKKSREDFLHRARALMVQRTMMILDSLAIETSVKSARWSFVLKNVLPHEWLEETTHGEGYRDGIEQVLDSKPASMRKSLELVRRDAKEQMLHSQITRRMSVDFGAKSISSTPQMSPRPSRYDYLSDIARYSRSPAGGAKRVPSRFHEAWSPEEQSLNEEPQEEIDLPFAPLSLGPPLSERAGSFEGAFRRSIDADMARYGIRRMEAPPPPSQERIRREVAALHRTIAAGEEVELTEKDREVRRRLLTAVLSHVRALSNASLVEFSVMHNLEEDCQRALDANEEGEEYDLFSFLDNRTREGRGAVYAWYLRLIEGKKLQGVTAITTAVIVSGIMTEILKEEILHESAIVQSQAEKLYQGAAALLNRLETMNSEAFEFVESQFAVYVCERKQDDVLEDLLASGIVDDQEFNTVHEELIEVRRKYVQNRHSIFYRGRLRLPAQPKPRQLLVKHPLFSSLPSELMEQVVDRYGELVHLKGGQALQSEKGSLVLVLEGMIRPLGDSVLPMPIASRIRKANTEVDLVMTAGPEAGERRGGLEEDAWQAVSSGPTQESNAGAPGVAAVPRGSGGFAPLGSGAEMHWCFPKYNGFCGPAVTLSSHGETKGVACAIARERAIETQFGCCEIAGKATVFTLPVNQVRLLARESETFRMEITRSLAREIVLESVSDQRPYCLSHTMDAVSGGLDVNTVTGRAVRVLERLPYMSVLALRSGECSSVHVQGPGVLLNGTVRVSIVDTSGLVGAINLLHEQLTGPALLPAGGLFLEEIHMPGDPSTLRENVSSIHQENSLQSERAGEASTTVENLYEGVDVVQSTDENGEADLGKILAHVLIEEISMTEDGVDNTALRRFARWTAADLIVDMNGRFGMNRHVELAPLTHIGIQ